MVPEGAMQDSKVQKKPAVSPNYAAYESQQQPAWHNSPKGVTVAHIPWQ